MPGTVSDKYIVPFLSKNTRNYFFLGFCHAVVSLIFEMAMEIVSDQENIVITYSETGGKK